MNGLGLRGNDINVLPVWKRGINGSGVVVSVVDDGVDFNHPDLFFNYNPESSWDFTRKTGEPLPGSPSDAHGTRCAGQIAAVKNDVCGMGVAYGAKFAAERLIANMTTDALEAMAFNFKFHDNDIYSSSWGPEDNGETVDGPGYLTQQALRVGATKGRRGKGSIFVFASGNGGLFGDNCNFDGYANSPYTISVGAVAVDGRIASYGEQCAAHLAVTYSGNSNIMIATTDVDGTCTRKHSGTSAAAPIAAGMIALMLSARPALQWRDIQHVIVKTAKETDPADVDWQVNGAGYHVSHKYGFGLLDADALVREAIVHKLVPSQALYFATEDHPNVEIPFGVLGRNVLDIAMHISETQAGQLVRLEHVTLTVRIYHQERRFLTIKLISPAGTLSILATERSYDDSNEGYLPWTFTTVRCWGESPVGKWIVQVSDS
ncbi:hypothetical protein M427DRAFT_96609, partial [Gonapodya prolifera JEL478]